MEDVEGRVIDMRREHQDDADDSSGGGDGDDDLITLNIEHRRFPCDNWPRVSMCVCATQHMYKVISASTPSTCLSVCVCVGHVC